jgi:hypothetical protein
MRLLAESRPSCTTDSVALAGAPYRSTSGETATPMGRVLRSEGPPEMPLEQEVGPRHLLHILI